MLFTLLGLCLRHARDITSGVKWRKRRVEESAPAYASRAATSQGLYKGWLLILENRRG